MDIMTSSTHSYQIKECFRPLLHDNHLNTIRKSGVAFPLFISRLDERLWVEICMHTVTQKCVKFDVVCMPGGLSIPVGFAYDELEHPTIAVGN